jgi:predicted DNA-binding mobile mystery protein A
MFNLNKNLITRQMDAFIANTSKGKSSIKPNSGWIQSVRLGLGMSLRQLAERMGSSISTINNFEKREQTEAITLASLKKTAAAMDMELVYYFKPKKGSIENTIEEQARVKAMEILKQSNQTMKLEDQATSKKSQLKELERLTKNLSNEMPADLWD